MRGLAQRISSNHEKIQEVILRAAGVKTVSISPESDLPEILRHTLERRSGGQESVEGDAQG